MRNQKKYNFLNGEETNEKEKSNQKPAKKRVKAKGPVYLCRTCGMEVVVTKEGTGINSLVCCDQVMDKK